MGIKGKNYGQKIRNNAKAKFEAVKNNEIVKAASEGFVEGVMICVGSTAGKKAFKVAKKTILK